MEILRLSFGLRKNTCKHNSGGIRSLFLLSVVRFKFFCFVNWLFFKFNYLSKFDFIGGDGVFSVADNTLSKVFFVANKPCNRNS
jgi:hypothetical protein